MKYLCPRGCGKVSQKKKDVSGGYFGACLTCDEDFYKFELIEMPDNNNLQEDSQKETKEEMKRIPSIINWHEHDDYYTFH